jgi:hypothetical protein
VETPLCYVNRAPFATSVSEIETLRGRSSQNELLTGSGASPLRVLAPLTKLQRWTAYSRLLALALSAARFLVNFVVGFV